MVSVISAHMGYGMKMTGNCSAHTGWSMETINFYDVYMDWGMRMADECNTHTGWGMGTIDFCDAHTG